MEDLRNLNDMHLSVFQEIGNIGAGNAATALASLLNRQMRMTVPNVSVVPFKNIADILGGPEVVVIGVMVQMTGDLNGFVMLVEDAADATKMINILTGSHDSVPEDFTFSEMQLSALTEISNILVGAYLSAISSMTGLNIVPSVPELTIDMASAIMSVPAIAYGEIADGVLFLQTQFFEDNEAMDGHFFMIPDLKSFNIMLRSLGIETDE